MPPNPAPQLETDLQIYNLEEAHRAEMDKQLINEAMLAQQREQEHIGMAPVPNTMTPPGSQPAATMATEGPNQVDIMRLHDLHKAFVKIHKSRHTAAIHGE